MEITRETLEQAEQDIQKYDLYLHECHGLHPTQFPTVFREIFGYEIILHESGGFVFKGERFPDATIPI